MAVEDGMQQELTPEIWAMITKSRRSTWVSMMESLPDKGYQVVDLRKEDGFMSRLAIKKTYEGDPRGIFIVCAGGGFLFKSFNEALPVAEYFYDQGINAAILDYHVSSGNEMGIDNGAFRMAGDDGLAAVRYLRANAAELGIDPDHIAIGGFSAGGMLSGYVATRFDYGDPAAQDPLQKVSSRPDAALILYGAFSSTSSIPAGPGAMTREEIAKACELDNVRHIRTDCPPMFVFQTHGDDPRIGLNFCMELAVHGVPYEIHTFEDGPHGGGLYNGKDETPDVPHTSLWSMIAADWLRTRGFAGK